MKERKLAQARREGELRAEDKHLLNHAVKLDKLGNPKELKKLWASISNHIGKFADKLDADSIVTLGGVAALTVMIQPFIQNAPEIAQRLTSSGVTETIALGRPAFQGLIGFFQGTPMIETKLDQVENITSWVLAFGVACLIIKFGPAVLQSVGGVVKLAGLLVAA